MKTLLIAIALFVLLLFLPVGATPSARIAGSINVSDIIFGTVLPGSVTTQTFTIKFTGDHDMTTKITSLGVLTPDEGVFSVQTPKLPFTLSGGDSIVIPITFTARARREYFAYLEVEHDANGFDNICEILANVAVTLYIPPLDFGRRRIGKGPYTTDKNGEAAYLNITNTLPTPITITNASVSGIFLSTKHFVADFSVLTNKTIQPNATLSIPVSYTPSEPNRHPIYIQLQTAEPESFIIADIVGSGIVPRAAILNINFGSVGLGDTAASRTVVIQNPSLNDWQYGDVLTITDIQDASNNQEISPIKDVAGSNGFFFDKQALKLPRTLQPGEILTFKAFFLPPSVSSFTSKLAVISDAQKETISTWTGLGTKPVGVIENIHHTEICSLQPHPIGSVPSMLSFRLDAPSAVHITLLSVTGQPLLSLAHAHFDAGLHSVPIDASALANGIYLLQYNSAQGVSTQTIVIIK